MMASLMAVAEHADKTVGDDHICHDHRVGVGHSEPTPAKTALPARMVGISRASVKKCVAEPGSPARSERTCASTVG